MVDTDKHFTFEQCWDVWSNEPKIITRRLPVLEPAIRRFNAQSTYLRVEIANYTIGKKKMASSLGNTLAFVFILKEWRKNFTAAKQVQKLAEFQESKFYSRSLLKLEKYVVLDADDEFIILNHTRLSWLPINGLLRGQDVKLYSITSD